MGSYYVTDLIAVLDAAGVECRVSHVNEGWEYRSRSSGGFPFEPLGIWWHHTASDASPEADLNWMINGSPDAPIGNMLLDRDGVVWPIAGGASNCAGSGGPWTFSRGTVPEDQGNSQGWQIEAANNGVGEPWPQAQIDAYFKVNNVLSAHFGNLPTDCITHNRWAPDRKVDPATAEAVQGPWRPARLNSSGSWSLLDIQAEAQRRAAPSTPIPQPTPGGDDMIRVDYGIPGEDDWWARMLIGGVGLTWVQGHANDGLDDVIPGHIQVADDQHMLDLMATFRCVGPPPSTWGNNPGLQNAWWASSQKE